MWPLSFFWVLLYESDLSPGKKKAQGSENAGVRAGFQIHVCLGMKPALRD